MDLDHETTDQHKKFIDAWRASRTIEEVSRRTGIGYDECKERARWYRDRGIDLNKLADEVE